MEIYFAESVTGDPYILLADCLAGALVVASEHNADAEHSWRPKHPQGKSPDYLTRIQKQPHKGSVLWIGRRSGTTRCDSLEGDEYVTVPDLEAEPVT